MEQNNKTTESVRIDLGAIEIAKEVKRHTGLPMLVFIGKAIRNELKKLPKSTKEKMNQEVFNL